VVVIVTTVESRAILAVSARRNVKVVEEVVVVAAATGSVTTVAALVTLLVNVLKIHRLEEEMSAALEAVVVVRVTTVESRDISLATAVRSAKVVVEVEEVAVVTTATRVATSVANAQPLATNGDQAKPGSRPLF